MNPVQPSQIDGVINLLLRHFRILARFGLELANDILNDMSWHDSIIERFRLSIILQRQELLDMHILPLRHPRGFRLEFLIHP